MAACIVLTFVFHLLAFSVCFAVQRSSQRDGLWRCLTRLYLTLTDTLLPHRLVRDRRLAQSGDLTVRFHLVALLVLQLAVTPDGSRTKMRTYSFKELSGASVHQRGVLDPDLLGRLY